MKKIVSISSLVVLCLSLFILPVSLSSLEPGSGGDTYERVADRVADRPSLMERQPAVDRSHAATATAMGVDFQNVRKTGKNRYTVTVKGWHPARMKPGFKGKISRVSLAKHQNKGAGKLIVITGPKGHQVTRESMKKPGVRYTGAAKN